MRQFEYVTPVHKCLHHIRDLEEVVFGEAIVGVPKSEQAVRWRAGLSLRLDFRLGAQRLPRSREEQAGGESVNELPAYPANISGRVLMSTLTQIRPLG